MATKDPLIEKAIELFALYGTPSTVFRDMYDQFGQDSLSVSQVKAVREKYRVDIVAKRKELSARIPLLDIADRWQYLQNIADSALQGDIIYDPRTGVPVEAKIDRAIALQSIKFAHEMAQAKGVVNDDDDDLIRQIVQDAYAEMKSLNPKKDNAKILEEILDELGTKSRPYVKELQDELINVQAVK
jgi:hypothetical protein